MLLPILVVVLMWPGEAKGRAAKKDPLIRELTEKLQLAIDRIESLEKELARYHEREKPPEPVHGDLSPETWSHVLARLHDPIVAEKEKEKLWRAVAHREIRFPAEVTGVVHNRAVAWRSKGELVTQFYNGNAVKQRIVGLTELRKPDDMFPGKTITILVPVARRLDPLRMKSRLVR